MMDELHLLWACVCLCWEKESQSVSKYFQIQLKVESIMPAIKCLLSGSSDRVGGPVKIFPPIAALV